MTWLTPILRERIQIVEPVNTPNSIGGFDRSYSTLLTIWASVTPLKFGSFLQQRYIRGVQTNEVVTHKVIIRRTAIISLGVSFSTGFSNGFDSITDINILKSDLFILVQRGSTTKGKLLSVERIEDFQERREYLTLNCSEIEEQGTGYPA
jgi:hypothetical protein